MQKEKTANLGFFLKISFRSERKTNKHFDEVKQRELVSRSIIKEGKKEEE